MHINQTSKNIGEAMNENEFEHDGKVYVASNEVATGRLGLPLCDGCAFDYENCAPIVPCTASKRKDNRNVIFIEKQGD